MAAGGAESRAVAPWEALGSGRVPTGQGGCPGVPGPCGKPCGALPGGPCPAGPALQPTRGLDLLRCGLEAAAAPAPSPRPEQGLSSGAAGVQRGRAGVPAPRSSPPRRPRPCCQQRPASSGMRGHLRSAGAEQLGPGASVRESARPGSPRGCRCACKRAHALRVCTAERRPRVGRGLWGVGWGGTAWCCLAAPGERRAGGVRASPRRRGSEGRARARRLCASRLQVSEQGTCLHCCLRRCLRQGRLQE